MKLYLLAFYVCYVLDVWPSYMREAWHRIEVYAIARDVAFRTDASPREGLRLMQIAGFESGFYRDARGKKGERGPWQVMPPAKSYGASEALHRMRAQGMLAYVGCTKASAIVTLPEGTKTTCAAMIEHRIGPADRYLEEHSAPSEE